MEDSPGINKLPIRCKKPLNIAIKQEGFYIYFHSKLKNIRIFKGAVETPMNAKDAL